MQQQRTKLFSLITALSVAATAMACIRGMLVNCGMPVTLTASCNTCNETCVAPSGWLIAPLLAATGKTSVCSASLNCIQSCIVTFTCAPCYGEQRTASISTPTNVYFPCGAACGGG